MFSHHFHPRGEGDGGEALLQRLVGNLPAERAQFLHTGQHDGSVADLVIAEQRQCERQACLREQPCPLQGSVHKCEILERRRHEAAALHLRRGADHIVRSARQIGITDADTSPLEDARLRKLNLLDGVAQHGGVLE